MNTTAVQYVSAYNEGLRKHMLNVFNHMGSGLIISAVISGLIGLDPTLYQFFMGGSQAWFFVLAPLALVLGLSFGISKLSYFSATVVFYLYSALMGISLSTIFATIKLDSIFSIFAITSATFLSMSLYGYVTKRDLSSFGNFLVMGLIGIVIAGLVNIFIQSSVFQFVISSVTVLIFTGLTAYDVQRIKDIYDETNGEERNKAGILGALALYLDFINIFVSLINLFGERK